MLGNMKFNRSHFRTIGHRQYDRYRALAEMEDCLREQRNANDSASDREGVENGENL